MSLHFVGWRWTGLDQEEKHCIRDVSYNGVQKPMNIAATPTKRPVQASARMSDMHLTVVASCGPNHPRDRITGYRSHVDDAGDEIQLNDAGGEEGTT
ncbi:unnamed protein product [Somion occarium]|uniref:Uncharacterized protein n=1 Tax=Somion occarium TaxID=3059160 RepID=A0ABP1E749_9APHY